MREIPVSFTLVLATPDEVNAIAREKGASVQAVSFTDSAANKVYVSAPPSQEYGYRQHDLDAALGYEIRSNVLHLDTDPLGT